MAWSSQLYSRFETARARLPDLQFELADIADWRATKPVDAILANASLNDHSALPARAGRAHWYYRLLEPICTRVNIWQTTYFHPLQNHQAIAQECPALADGSLLNQLYKVKLRRGPN